uniref:Two pore segment channel 2 n=1 Tax=Neogobius melanostomus TaxID=47308 RepID=A0A8C6UVM0_9GOBI
MVCLLIFTLDLATKSYLIGWDEFRKSKWLIGYTVVITISMIDWMLSVSMVCDERLRVRRLFRPFFLLQNSSLMKKTLKCIKRTLPEIARYKLIYSSVLPLLLMPVEEGSSSPPTNPHPAALTADFVDDVPMLSGASFSFPFLFTGTYCLMNLLTAIIYNQFRGYLLMSVQTSIIRRRLGIRAAFQVLSCGLHQPACIQVATLLKVMSKVNLKSYYKRAVIKVRTEAQRHETLDCDQFRGIFDELDKDIIKEHPPLPHHYALTIIGNAVALANVICICTILVLNSEKSTSERDNFYMELINLIFILYYLFEMSAKLFAFGWRGYFSFKNNIFDGILTVLLLLPCLAYFGTYRDPDRHDVISLWELMRLINMLIVFRFLRIIPDIKLMALVASTLVDLVKNLRAFAGILVVVFYIFAVFGIWLFQGAIKPPPHPSAGNSSMENITSNFSALCGTYEQLEYWPNNFDDFAAAIILLYDVMIVNNWQAFIEAYSRYTTEWSKIYFVSWWLTSSVMWVNLFVALILENFIYKWDRSCSCSVTDMERIRYETSVQLMFKEQIQEPTEEELVCQLNQHPHLHLDW